MAVAHVFRWRRPLIHFHLFSVHFRSPGVHPRFVRFLEMALRIGCPFCPKVWAAWRLIVSQENG
jgi:hypothetical protein